MVATDGPIRGFIARWLMRMEAAGNILRMAFLGVTAASTLTSALALIGLERYAPGMLAVGLAGTLVFAFSYVELGVYNRKNREQRDRGVNFAGPDMRMDDELIARGMLAALERRPLTDEERTAIKDELDSAWAEYRNGIPIED